MNTKKTDQLKQKAQELNALIEGYKTALVNVEDTTRLFTQPYQENYRNGTSKLEELKKDIKSLYEKRQNLISGLKVDSIETNNKSIYQTITSVLRTLKKKQKDLIIEIADLTSEEAEHVSDKENFIKASEAVITAFEQKKFDPIPTELSDPSGVLLTTLGVNKCQEIINIFERNKDRFTIIAIYYHKDDKEECSKFLNEYIVKQDEAIQTLKDKIKSRQKESSTIPGTRLILENKYNKLKTLDRALENITNKIKTIQEDLQTLFKTHAEKIQQTYNPLSHYLPEKNVVPPGEEHKAHQRNLRVMICDLNLMEARLTVFSLNRALPQHQIVLSNLQDNLTNLEIKSASFQHVAGSSASFAEQWRTHAKRTIAAITASKISLATIAVDLAKAEEEMGKLSKQLKDVYQNLSQIAKEMREMVLPEDSELSHLLNTKDSICKELTTLETRVSELQKLWDQKNITLNTQKAIYSRENKKTQTYQNTLSTADRCKKDIEEQATLLSLHKYGDTFIESITQGKMRANCIEREDKFYPACESRLSTLQIEINKLKKALIKGEKISGLDRAFNQALNEKITACETQLPIVRDTKAIYQDAWQNLSQNNKVIRDSRQVIEDGKSPDLLNADYTNYDLRGIKLKKRDFKNISIQGVDFRNANISSCCFDKANFQNVKLSEFTRIDWAEYGYKILRDNLADPYINTSVQEQAYLSNLIRVVSKKKEISAAGILVILKEIGATEPPCSSDEKTHLQAQQQHAVFFMQQIIPHLSLNTLLELHDLIAKKHYEDDRNPYKFIRRELDFFRMKYGNTKPWEEIITPIKDRLNELANGIANDNNNDRKMSEEQYKKFDAIMRTQTKHTCGFGNLPFFKPELAERWEERKNDLVKSVVMPARVYP